MSGDVSVPISICQHFLLSCGPDAASAKINKSAGRRAIRSKRAMVCKPRIRLALVTRVAAQQTVAPDSRAAEQRRFERLSTLVTLTSDPRSRVSALNGTEG